MAVIQNPTINNQEEDKQKGQNQFQTIATATPQTGGPQQTAPMRPQTGSGRFTNIQKYLQANQGAGQRVAQQIGQNIKGDLSKQQQKAQDYYGQLGQNIQQSRQVAETGLGFKGKLEDIGQQIGQAKEAGFQARGTADLGLAEQFRQSPDFQQFQNIQAGRGIDENLLALQQQRAYTQAESAALAAQQAREKLGSESGRFELLRQTFGGGTRPGYSTGQQRLDQMILGQAGGLTPVQAELAAEQRKAQEQSRLAGLSLTDVASLTEQERGLMKGYEEQAKKNEQLFVDLLSSYADPVQQQREAEYKALGESVGAYVPTYNEKTKRYEYSPVEQGTGFTTEQMQRLGVDPTQGVYNVFRGSEFMDQDALGRAAALANKGIDVTQGSDLQRAQNIANAQEVARYKALADIIGKEYVPQITQADKAGAAWEARQGSEGLASRLSEAQKAFEDLAKSTTISSGDYYKGQTRGNIQDIINKGLYGYQWRDDAGSSGKWVQSLMTPTGVKKGPSEQYLYDRDIALKNKYGEMGKSTKKFKDFIKAQNYSQTLGGKRETYLDTLYNEQLLKNKIAPKLSGVEVTGKDPMLEYIRSLTNKED